MPTNRRRVAILGVMGLAVGTATSLASSSPSIATGATTSTVQNTGHGYVTKTIFANGDTVRVYAATPMHINAPGVTTAAAQDGVTAHSASGTATPDLAKVPLINGKPQLMSTPSAYEELIALGAPKAIAAKFLDAGGSSTPTTRAAAVKPNSIIDDNNCASSSASSGHINMYGCDTTSKVGSSGSVWYLEDKFLATGTAHGGPRLTGLKFGLSYGSGNRFTHWSPSSTANMGNCASNTVGVTYAGVSVSSTTTECPETFGVYDINSTLFTAKWDGQGNGPSNGARDSHGVDSVYNGTSASPYPSLVWKYWWV